MACHTIAGGCAALCIRDLSIIDADRALKTPQCFRAFLPSPFLGRFLDLTEPKARRPDLSG